MGPWPLLRNWRGAILRTVYKETQVLVTTHLHETDPRQHSQGLVNLPDIITWRRWTRSYALKWPWLIIYFKNTKNFPEVFNRTQTFITQYSKCPGSKITWHTKKHDQFSREKNNQQMPTEMNRILEWSVRVFIAAIKLCSMRWRETLLKEVKYKL